VRLRPDTVRNVFVLGTGRCGTVTFSRAASHLAGYTSGHESLSGRLADGRFHYPDRHVEADNRLSWFLGELGRRFDDDRTLYVHLTRRRDDVVSSFANRWESPFRASIIRAFGHGIVKRSAEWEPQQIREVCAFYVDTVNTNIEEFVRHRNSLRVQLEDIEAGFAAVVEALGVSVDDPDEVRKELATRHNAS